MNPLTLPNDPLFEPVNGHSINDCNDLRVQTSLFAEYAGMVLCTHAIFCAASRVLTIGGDVFGVFGIAACLWVAVRAICIVRWRWFVSIITVVNIGLLAWFEFAVDGQESPWTSGGPFSSTAVMIMLALVLSIDLTETAFAVRRRIQVPEKRDRLTAFVMRHGLRTLLWGTLMFILTYSIVVPIVQETIYQQSAAAQVDPKFAEGRLTLPNNVLFKFTESMSGI